ncbi:hypothetical protein WR25_01010 [Diploscapter pachys]|uniref:N-terminal methionine N(alpha)-acetyltransferase NatC n=1 Tax=Diploscapter pachys TaxID=2018661 RepID=A0A2A2KGU8_9BILA|nr:hypothetical protein WR25_01010 [Diploscapter pachys]
MAIGAPKGSGEASNLDVAIGTLRRCLQMASTSSAPQKPVQNVVKDSPAIATVKQILKNTAELEERSSWPHCQHFLSADEPKVVKQQAKHIKIIPYKDETQIGDIMRLITKDLSEPYSIYTYRYFIHQWPELCYLAYDTETEAYVGAIVCKLDYNNKERRQGYVAMLAVDEGCRRLGVGTTLVRRAIESMQVQGCDEVCLETEVSNKNSQRLYSNLGFIPEKRLIRYYLNGGDAYRLKLYFTPPSMNSVINRRSSQITIDDRCSVSSE